MTTETAGIEFIDIKKAYGRETGGPLAVKGISFSIPKGTLTTLLGPSGCGKTTTLRMIAGLERPTAGKILINGQDVTVKPPSARNVSLVFQSYALFPHMSVLDNVAYGLVVSGEKTAAAHERASNALANVGLPDLGHRWPSDLSGGQQQRVALARALVLEPAVLLFDEPLSNLDARLRRQMRDEIRALQQRLQLTVAYVTHDQSEALAVSDQIIVMREGTIAQIGAPKELYERPNSEFVAAFMGEATLFPAVAGDDGQIRLGPLQIKPVNAVRSGAARLAVRPEAWIISRGEGELPGQVMKRAYLGGFMEYTVSTELGDIFVVNPDVVAMYQLGEPVTLSLANHGVSALAA